MLPSRRTWVQKISLQSSTTGTLPEYLYGLATPPPLARSRSSGSEEIFSGPKYDEKASVSQGWGQLHNINSNSNSRGFNSNSNSGQSPEYQLQLQLQLRRFQLQLQFQLRQISRISTPTPTPTPEVSTPTPIPTPEISTPIPTPEFQIQPQLHFKSNQTCSTKLPLPNYNVTHCMNLMEICCRYMPCCPKSWPNRSTLA